MRVKVLNKAYYYNRRMYEVGEELDMDDREDGNVDILTKIGQLEVVTPSARSGTGYRTTALKAQPAQAVKAEPPAEAASTAVEPMSTENTEELADHPNRRVYRRRDMKPQE